MAKNSSIDKNIILGIAVSVNKPLSNYPNLEVFCERADVSPLRGGRENLYQLRMALLK